MGTLSRWVAVILAWLQAHRRILMLKVAVGAALVFAHYFPETQASLYVNLIWLLLF